MLGSKIFKIFINGLEESRILLINFTDDTRPEGRINNDMERSLVQGDLIIWQPGQANMYFNKVIDELIHLRATSGGDTYLT